MPVLGTLNAGDPSGSPVSFTSYQSGPAAGDWGGIRFYDQSSGFLDNCVVEYATTGVYFLARTSPQITNSTIRYNKRGIHPDSYGSHIPQPVVNDCSIYGNTEHSYLCEVPAATTLDATGNWWGTDNPNEIGVGIYDYGEAHGRGVVNYLPFLDSENGASVTTAPGGELYLAGVTQGDVTLSGSYAVPSFFLVQSGHTVRIEAGTTIKFMPGAYMPVLGTLNAGDPSGSPVSFTSYQSGPAAGDWGGIRFY
ncbi:MAG: right-handed parallel beta-helix repeat-containing protein, partial [Gammaproteobacteria bacterium]|nr:right-handed parallel beta-helix repeat-containing protein [Gammaproteobacteria bacterium]